jgi:hypothetical protein
MTSAPDCQYTCLPSSLMVMLLQEPHKVMTLAYPRTSTVFLLQAMSFGL